MNAYNNLDENDVLRKKATYSNANKLFETSSIKKLQEAKRLYDSLGDWEDSVEKSYKCLEKIKSIEKNKKIIAGISIVLIIAFFAIATYSNSTTNTSNYDVVNNEYQNDNYDSSSSKSSSSNTTTSHTCIVDGCYKTATHYLNGTSGDEWYCDEHYEWMEDFAEEIMSYSDDTPSYSSGSHSCAICNKSASYEDPYDKGTWYCYEHYNDAIDWYLNN